MRKAILPVIFLISILPLSASGPFCRQDGDTLVIGNSLVERTFVWNGGNLRTVSVTDCSTGKVFRSVSKDPDFSFVRGNVAAPGATLEVLEMPQTPIRPACTTVRIVFTVDRLQVRRDYRLYDGVAAVACDTYLRGSADTGVVQKEGNSADRTNIESQSVASQIKPSAISIDRLSLPGRQWRCKAVEFRDVTDWNNNLVSESQFMSYHRTGYRGNLLFVTDVSDMSGLWFLKESPCSDVQLSYGGADFYADYGKFTVTGAGISPDDISEDEWTPAYSCVLGVNAPGELAALTSLRKYQQKLRRHLPQRDEMIMMNTWGDRSQDSKVNESFCLSEIERAARLGVTLFQIDDGWQAGKSPNSKVSKGSFKDIWQNPDYWTPDPQKYPHGLAPIVSRGKELGVEIGLWFNPSVQNDFEDWEKDAALVIGLWKEYGIKVFKIDGVSMPTKLAEMNLRRFFGKVLEETGDEVVFNLDVTAGRRGGYHFFCEYGNTFLENRYTDWANYYPYWTLRNIWMLSRYVPAERLQVEFLNPWRNAEKYGSDAFAPSNYDFGYIFATSMAGQPLAWMEAGNLPDEAFDTASAVRAYKDVMADLHSGVILPVGDEPSGRSWTGFQSIVSDTEGYMIIYRESTEDPSHAVKTWFPDGVRVRFEPVCGSGKKFTGKSSDGEVRFELPERNSYALYRYTVCR